MKVIRYPNSVPRKNTVLVLGGFEAFHLGHVALLDQARALGNAVTMLMIAEPTQLPKHATSAYATLATRLQQMANYGIDQVLLVNFTDEIRCLKGLDFLNQVLSIVRPRAIVVGHDFAMGFNRDLHALDIKARFAATYIVDHIRFGNAKMSTTVMRELVETGAVDIIKKLSPFAYTIATRVAPDGLFTFTTTMPQRGVYAAWAVVNEIKMWAIVHIGFKHNQVIIPDLDVRNSGYDVSLELRKMVRPIIRSEQDTVTANDQQAVADYLYRNP